MLKLIVKCWKSKNGKLVKGLFYENKNGRFLMTFDKFAIAELVGGLKEYKKITEGDELVFEMMKIN